MSNTSGNFTVSTCQWLKNKTRVIKPDVSEWITIVIAMQSLKGLPKMVSRKRLQWTLLLSPEMCHLSPSCNRQSQKNGLFIPFWSSPYSYLTSKFELDRSRTYKYFFLIPALWLNWVNTTTRWSLTWARFTASKKVAVLQAAFFVYVLGQG